ARERAKARVVPAEQSLTIDPPPSCTTPAASTIISSQKIADCGGSVAACVSSSSNDKLSVHEKLIRFESGSDSFPMASFQNLSIGEVPTTTVTFLVFGNTRKIFSMAAK